MRSKASIRRPYSCNLCSVSFSSYANAEKHFHPAFSRHPGHAIDVAEARDPADDHRVSFYSYADAEKHFHPAFSRHPGHAIDVAEARDPAEDHRVSFYSYADAEKHFHPAFSRHPGHAVDIAEARDPAEDHRVSFYSYADAEKHFHPAFSRHPGHAIDVAEARDPAEDHRVSFYSYADAEKHFHPAFSRHPGHAVDIAEARDPAEDHRVSFYSYADAEKHFHPAFSRHPGHAIDVAEARDPADDHRVAEALGNPRVKIEPGERSGEKLAVKLAVKRNIVADKEGEMENAKIETNKPKTELATVKWPPKLDSPNGPTQPKAQGFPHQACALCAANVTLNRRAQREHVTSRHMASPPLSCKACGKGFTRRHTAKQHMQSAHLRGASAESWRDLCAVRREPEGEEAAFANCFPASNAPRQVLKSCSKCPGLTFTDALHHVSVVHYRTIVLRCSKCTFSKTDWSAADRLKRHVLQVHPNAEAIDERPKHREGFMRLVRALVKRNLDEEKLDNSGSAPRSQEADAEGGLSASQTSDAKGVRSEGAERKVELFEEEEEVVEGTDASNCDRSEGTEGIEEGSVSDDRNAESSHRASANRKSSGVPQKPSADEDDSGNEKLSGPNPEQQVKCLACEEVLPDLATFKEHARSAHKTDAWQYLCLGRDADKVHSKEAACKPSKVEQRHGVQETASKVGDHEASVDQMEPSVRRSSSRFESGEERGFGQGEEEEEEEEPEQVATEAKDQPDLAPKLEHNRSEDEEKEEPELAAGLEEAVEAEASSLLTGSLSPEFTPDASLEEVLEAGDQTHEMKPHSSEDAKAAMQLQTLLPCLKCGKKIRNVYMNRRQHIAHMHTKRDNAGPCAVCQVYFRCPFSRLSHFKKFHPGADPCKRPPKVVLIRSEIAALMKECFDPQLTTKSSADNSAEKFLCVECSGRFSGRHESLLLHASNMHWTLPIWSCSLKDCDWSSHAYGNGKAFFRVHLKRGHTAEERSQCGGPVDHRAEHREALELLVRRLFPSYRQGAKAHQRVGEK